MTLAAHQLELLAPARDADIGIQAITHGADAVYIGGPAFGARAGAGNSVQDIARLVSHAHRFNARIFVTLNTILRDDELEAARQLTWQMYDAGVDALIVQDMGLLEIDLPPIQLHASTQNDIRTPEKARFLQDAGFSQIVVARELTLQQIYDVSAALDPERCALEFFVHGALCVAYSGQCFISHAHTGRSANRGDCSQACRLPYNVLDAQGRVVAHEKHVLSMKDNNQSDNLRALVAAGARSFKIEGRYKDMGYVKNITGHYRQLLDAILEEDTTLTRASDGQTRLSFTPDPDQNFNRGATDYFVTGRKMDVGAFDTPKHLGSPIGWVTAVDEQHFDVEVSAALSNGDGFTWFDLQGELQGVPANRVECLRAQPEHAQAWRIFPRELVSTLKDVRAGTALNRNRDMNWVRGLERESAQRHIPVWLNLTETPEGLALSAMDEHGVAGHAHITLAHMPPKDASSAASHVESELQRLGGTDFVAEHVALSWAKPRFIPASQLKSLRREAIAALAIAREVAYQRPPRAVPVQPPAPYPEDSLSYLANVLNHKAADFYAKHGVKVIDAAYEAQEELGDVSLMITKHCVRFSLSLCPKQAKGVQGVQGTVRAEPMTLINGSEKLLLRFDCKPCEMHVVGRMKKNILSQTAEAAKTQPLQFYKKRPVAPLA
jgi:23S rRNA 5-hydroxycytidine C2501 synthase